MLSNLKDMRRYRHVVKLKSYMINLYRHVVKLKRYEKIYVVKRYDNI